MRKALHFSCLALVILVTYLLSMSFGRYLGGNCYVCVFKITDLYHEEHHSTRLQQVNLVDAGKGSGEGTLTCRLSLRTSPWLYPGERELISGGELQDNLG
jgi:hypothetical protein